MNLMPSRAPSVLPPTADPHVALEDLARARDEAIEEARRATLRSQWFEERFRQVINTSTIAYFAVDSAGVVLDWNSAAERVFGWSAEETVGRKVVDTVLVTPFSAEDLDRVAQLDSGDGRSFRGKRLRSTGRRTDGTTFPLGVDLWHTRYGDAPTFNVFAYDLTGRPSDEKPLCEMGSLIESSGDAIIGTDLHGTILTWNHAAEETFGYSAKEALGRDVALIVPDDHREEAAQSLAELLDGKPVEHQHTVRLGKDGTPVDVALTVSLVRNSEGVVTGFSTIARNVSDDGRMDAQLDETLRSLENAVREAEAAEARGRNFLADVAHQLRTPIAGIKAGATTLLEGVPGPTRDRLLSGIARETSRAARLVTALLQMSRLDQGELLTLEPCDLVELCQEEAERVTLLSPELKVDVRVAELDDEDPEVDVGALHEIIGNLLDNARRHATSQVEVVVSYSGGEIEVRVADDGPGLPDDMVERAFERFVSLDGQGGSGLGLSIGRGLARAHGGDLTCEDGCFVLRVPARNGELTSTEG